MAEATGYRAVIDWIRQAVASGELRKGDRLPSEKELCEQFGLSRQTIRHATGELEKEGLLTRVRGSGVLDQIYLFLKFYLQIILL